MNRGFCVFSAIFFIAAGTARAQEISLEEILPGLKDRALVLNFTARVIEQNQQEIWNEENQRVTIPGRPVGIKLVGANVVVALQFTPYLRRKGPNVLVAQGQIWIDIPNQGIHYQTTMQTIPMEFNEPIYFFPLGPISAEDEACIEIMIKMNPYREPSSGEESAQTVNQNGNDSSQ
jgi:hypothetical protein